MGARLGWRALLENKLKKRKKRNFLIHVDFSANFKYAFLIILRQVDKNE